MIYDVNSTWFKRFLRTPDVLLSDITIDHVLHSKFCAATDYLILSFIRDADHPYLPTIIEISQLVEIILDFIFGRAPFLTEQIFGQEISGIDVPLYLGKRLPAQWFILIFAKSMESTFDQDVRLLFGFQELRKAINALTEKITFFLALLKTEEIDQNE